MASHFEISVTLPLTMASTAETRTLYPITCRKETMLGSIMPERNISPYYGTGRQFSAAAAANAGMILPTVILGDNNFNTSAECSTDAVGITCSSEGEYEDSISEWPSSHNMILTIT